jgi:sugar phosphate isomerase/epimerase
MPWPWGCEIEVKRTLTLTFGHFGWRSLAAEARRERRSLEELLSRAAAYFGSELGTDRGALAVPPHTRQRQAHGSGIELALPGIELALPAAVWRELGEEAARQRVGLGRLLEHAALYYLAAVDSGREAARLTDADGHRGAHSTLTLTGRRPGAACPPRQ